jgi:hypothetical protein
LKDFNYTYKPIICDAQNTLYIGDLEDARIWSYSSDASLLFSLQVPPNISAGHTFPGAIGEDGVLYFGEHSDLVVAIH